MGVFSIVGKSIEKSFVEAIWSATKAYHEALGNQNVREELHQNICRLTYYTKIFGEKPEDLFGPDFFGNCEKYYEAYNVRNDVYNIVDALLHAKVPKERVYAVLEAVGVEVIDDANV